MIINAKSRILSAARQLSGQDQPQLSEQVALAIRTISAAERGEQLTDKTWTKLTAYYKSIGIEIIERDSGWIIIFEDVHKIN